jgi:hypothetical protein
VVEGAVVDVDGSLVAGAVVADSVDDVDVGLVGGAVVEAVVVDVDSSVVAGAVVGGSVDVVGDGVVEGSVGEVVTVVVTGSVGGVPLCWASWVTMRRTAAPCVYGWLGVVVVVNSVDGAVAVDEFLLEAAFAMSRPAATSTPAATTGISIWAQRGSARKRCTNPGPSVPPASPPVSGEAGPSGGLTSLISMASSAGRKNELQVRAVVGVAAEGARVWPAGVRSRLTWSSSTHVVADEGEVVGGRVADGGVAAEVVGVVDGGEEVVGVSVVLGGRVTVVVLGERVVLVGTAVVDVGGTWLVDPPLVETTAMMMVAMITRAPSPMAIHMPRRCFRGRYWSLQAVPSQYRSTWALPPGSGYQPAGRGLGLAGQPGLLRPGAVVPVALALARIVGIWVPTGLSSFDHVNSSVGVHSGP